MSTAVEIPEDLLRSLTQSFALRAAEHDREASFPFENFDTLHRHGLIGLTVPRALGGLDGSLRDARRVIQAVARGEPSTALVLVMQYVFQRMVARNPDWPRHLQTRIGRDAVDHGALINGLSVEPELGTPMRGGLPATIGRRSAGGWRLSGHKLYSTGIPALTWLAVVGRTDDAEPRLGMFLVPRNAPGIRVIESWDHLGMRATGSHEVVLTDVAVPEDHLIPFQRLGERTDPEQVREQAFGTVLTATLYDSVARAARDWLLRFLTDRVPSALGAPLASLPRFQEIVGGIDALLLANRVLLDETTARFDAGGAFDATETPLIKYLVTANAIAITSKALESVGNPALSRANPLERHHRDVLCSRIHTPQNDVILTQAGRSAFASIAAERLAAE